MAEEIIVQDVSLDLTTSLKGSIIFNTNAKAINDMIKKVFTTFKGQILFNPTDGNSLEELSFEFESVDLPSVLTELLKREIPYIVPQVTVENVDRTVKYTVKYSIKNDENIGASYKTQDTI